MNARICDRHFMDQSTILQILKALQVYFYAHNWLISGHECWSDDLTFNNKLKEKCVWISTTDLVSLLETSSFGVIWAVFSAFPPEVTEEEVLKDKLPYADGQVGFWIDEVQLQHRLADFEIVAWENIYTLVLCDHDDVMEDFDEEFEGFEDLSSRNRIQNAQVRHIESLIIKVLHTKGIRVDSRHLEHKYQIWRNTYMASDVPLSEEALIYETEVYFHNRGFW